MENLSQDSQPLGQDLNQKPPEYEAGVLLSRLRNLLSQKTRIIKNKKFWKELIHLFTYIIY
jgi:hypothetical protein